MGYSFDFVSFRAVFLSRPPAPVYSFIFTPGLCCTSMGVFLARRSLHMRVQVASPVLGPATTLHTFRLFLVSVYDDM